MADHILNRRARFWLWACDAVERWNLPESWWRFALARANAAIDFGPPLDPDVVERDRGPW